VHFTLDATNNITLDDIAHLQFGARLTSVGDKITAFAPAAPDAIDDVGTTHEDQKVQLFVLGNDADADGTGSLKITEIHQEPGAHGTVTIAADGKSLFYTPSPDYAGLNTDANSVDDTFVYCVTDANGGEDHATVNMHIIPVADAPQISLETFSLAGDPVNSIRLHVAASQSDLDGSEFIDRIAFTGLGPDVTLVGLPGGVIDDSGQPGSVSYDVQLLLPTTHDTNFDLGVTAYSQEKGIGDPDEASATALNHIELDTTHNTALETFTSTDQSIWDTGNGFVIDRHDFLGINDHWSADFGALGVSVGGSLTLKLGFESNLHLTLGDITATLPFNLTLDTLYNKTTDTLEIIPTASLAPGGSFSTHSPNGSYNLGFDFYADPYAFLHNPIDDIDTHFGGPFGDPDNPVFNIVDLNTATDLTKDIPIPPPPNDIVTLHFAWPTVNTTSGGYDPSVTSSISTDPTTEHSNDIFNLDLDLVALAFAIIGVPNPLGIVPGVDILAVNVDGGVNMAQHFDLNALGLNATLEFENGTSQPFVFGSPLIFDHASNLDGSDPGSEINFDLNLTPNATLHNDTGLGFHVGFDIKVLDTPLGTVLDLNDDFPLGDISLYDKTFGLNFDSQHYTFLA
jgi:hypothetical protein